MAATTKIDLKLLIDTKTKKVVFAEAKKDFVDLLFGLLQVPIGSIMKKLLENEMEGAVGSIGKVYKSVIDLESSYLLHNASKDLLLWPEMSSSSESISIPPLLQNFSDKPKCVRIVNTTSAFGSGSPAFGSSSPAFGSSVFPFSSTASSKSEGLVREMTSSKPEGFVREMTLYMVMDDLMVKPLSPVSTITLLNSIGVKDFSSLVEKNVTINFKKVLELVKTSFVSNTVLSDVFTSNQAPAADKYYK